MPVNTQTASSHEEVRNLANTAELLTWLEALAEMKLGDLSERDARQTSCAKWLMTVGRKAVMKSGEIRDFQPQDLPAEPEWIRKSLAEGRPVHILQLGSRDRSQLERAMDWLMSPDGPSDDADWSRVSLSGALEAEAKWVDEMARQAADCS